MATAPLIPQSFWFRLAYPCRRIEGVPRKSAKGRLLDLPETCRLTSPTLLDGREPWAEIRAAWNPAGLAIAVEVTGKLGPIARRDPEVPDLSDGIQVWIDTRDTRDVHRATKFCHRFAATLDRALPGDAGGPRVEVIQRTIHRALGDAPRARVGSILTRAEASRKSWLLELFFPAAALNGFEPETNRRLGLMIQVIDPDRGDLFLGVGREFPVGEDPSLWPTLELVDNPD